MGYRLLTDLTLCIHFAFLVFVVCGGLLVRRYHWLLVPHLLAAGWGVYVEAMPGLRCPLTALENVFADKAGLAGYSGTFIQHYLAPIIYPDGLTPLAQRALAVAVVLINAVVYAWPRRSRGGSDRMDTARNDPAITALRVVKVVHTLVWALFAGCIVAIPIVAWRRNIDGALVLIAIVGVEVLVLLVNRLRCPLTDIAASYTQDRRDNFDIYLPLWIARYNKHIFGALFAGGILYTAMIWRGMRG